MSPELARNLIYSCGWVLLVIVVFLPFFLHWKYGFGKPKYLRRIGEYLALRGFTLTAGKRSPTASILHDGALYTIRYHDALGQEYEAVASVTSVAGVFIGDRSSSPPRKSQCRFKPLGITGPTWVLPPSRFLSQQKRTCKDCSIFRKRIVA